MTGPMHYKFPTITHLDQVKEAIAGYDEFKVNEKEGYIVVNYSVALDKTFEIKDIENPTEHELIRRECRGLIFSLDGKLLSRPYHKFFNIGERPETDPNIISLRARHAVLEKLDGSMIRPIPTEYGFRLATKAGITDVAMKAEVFVADKPEYAAFIHSCFKRDITPIFEWCSRKNRIVVDYPEDNLILTAVRSNKNGLYSKYNFLYRLASNFKIPCIKKYAPGINFEELTDNVRDWKDEEGVVVRFDDGHMVKIKSLDYVLKHRSKDSIGLEKNVIEIILNDNVDDLIPLLSEQDANHLKEFQSKFWNGVDELSKEMVDLFTSGSTAYPDKKDFAVNFVQKMILPIHAPIMYGLWQEKEIKDIIIDLIKKCLGSQTKIDANRWLWGGHVWNV